MLEVLEAAGRAPLLLPILVVASVCGAAVACSALRRWRRPPRPQPDFMDMVAAGAAGGIIVAMIAVKPAHEWVFRGLPVTFRWWASVYLAFVVALLPAIFTGLVFAARSVSESPPRR